MAEEDYIGPRRTIVGDRYTHCNRCGRLMPRRQAQLVTAEPDEEMRSEVAEICAECRRELDQGEPLLPPEA